MTQFSRIGLDTSKAVFTLHCIDASEKPLLRVNLRRAQLIPFFKKQRIHRGRHGSLRRLASPGAGADRSEP